MSLILFLARNWDNVAIICAAIAGGVALYKKGETRLLKEILFRLVTQAEAEFGGDTGELKKPPLSNGYIDACSPASKYS